jgi:hypothetical protein
MRSLVQILKTIIAIFIGGSILVLPQKMLEHYVIGHLTEYVADKVFDVLGTRPPIVEEILSRTWLFMPYLVVALLFYVYHHYYLQSRLDEQKLIKERRSWSLLDVFNIVLIAGVLLCFAGGMIWASYEYHAPVSTSLKYSDLTALPNYELRERAFAAAKKLTALQNDYEAKQREVNEPYEKALVAWNKASDDYKTQLDDYNKRGNPFSLSYILEHPLVKSESPPIVVGNVILPSGTPAPPSLGSPPSTPILSGALTLPPTPMPTTPPPSKPEPPVVKVDDGWKDALTEAQQEASAVWEEICHRQGHYPPMFSIPSSYNYPWPVEGDLAEQAKRLESLANSLH